GINWIDTAAVYGLGHSEEVVGRAIAGIPEADRPYVFTKCGLVWDPDNRSAAPRKIMSAVSVRREVEDSLRRLGVERLDLYQVHWPGDGRSLDWGGTGDDAPSPAAVPLEEYWQTMAELRVEGKVRAIGLSNHDVAQLEIAETIAHVDAIQPPFSLLDRSAGDQLEWAAKNGTGAIVYQPMYSGLLTGAFDRDRVAALPPDDWRRTAPAFTADLDRNLSVVDAMRPIADRHDTSVSSVAIAWTLAWPGVTGAIVGARRPAQVDAWARAGSVELTQQDLVDLASAIRSAGVGKGPTHP
ncbi:MAG: aldo/keto reductase, partial [Kutzneria sp.]|nr:aldo/keto reductase [Kutzneria sp.]